MKKRHKSSSFFFCYIYIMEESINTIYVRFDKNLDYKVVVNSFPIKKFLEGVFGDFPHMISPKEFTFDRDKLGEFIQEQYRLSLSYIMESKRVPAQINKDYYDTINQSGEFLTLNAFEPEVLLDDQIVTINSGDKVLGFFATEDDFRNIINR